MGKTKSRWLMIFLLAVIPVFQGFVKPKLVRTKVNDKISVLIPGDWVPMEGMDFIQRYPSVRAPLAAFTNVERDVDFSINISATQWSETDLPLAQKFFKASLYNMFDKVTMIEEGVHTIGKKKLIFFEFDSRVEGNRKKQGEQDPVLKYTYIQYLIEKDKTTVFSFNSPLRLKEEWQETARHMMTSIKLK